MQRIEKYLMWLFNIDNFLVSWIGKKQNCISLLLTTKVAYIDKDNHCIQLLWIKHTMEDFKIKNNTLFILCNNTGIVNVLKNPMMHGRTKHINRFNFIMERIEDKIVVLKHIPIENQHSMFLQSPWISTP